VDKGLDAGSATSSDQKPSGISGASNQRHVEAISIEASSRPGTNPKAPFLTPLTLSPWLECYSLLLLLLLLLHN